MFGKFMRLSASAVVLAAALVPAAAAVAQTPPAELGARYVPAPWWMREPVIASVGRVRTELPANRASFTVQFQVIDRTAATATARAAAKVAEFDAALRALGPDSVRVETTFVTRPLYDQYRDKDGNVIENQRSDKIERYEVTSVVRLDVRDMALLERVYNAALAAEPTSVGQVGYRLEPDNAAKTWLAVEAAKDAARRARQSAEAVGTRLGAVKVIDPTGRACETDVLAGWPAYTGGGQATDVDYAGAPPPPPPAPPPPPVAARAGSGGQSESVRVTLQPPRQWLSDEACVVYGLG